MDAQVKAWKRAADKLATGPALDYRAAVEVAGEIARRQGADAGLQQAAAQALPNLRAALASGADRRTKAIAERRFAVIRDLLHLLTLPRFGKRESPDKVLTPEEHHRRLLGLPLTAGCSAPRSMRPTSRRRSGCIPTPAATSAISWRCPGHAMR